MTFILIRLFDISIINYSSLPNFFADQQFHFENNMSKNHFISTRPNMNSFKANSITFFKEKQEIGKKEEFLSKYEKIKQIKSLGPTPPPHVFTSPKMRRGKCFRPFLTVPLPNLLALM